MINTAFETLLGAPPLPPGEAGGAGGPSLPAPTEPHGDTDPLGAAVTLMRALWTYMHEHGLCRKLAKPFKMACALRNLLLVSDMPLFARCGRYSCQLSACTASQRIQRYCMDASQPWPSA